MNPNESNRIELEKRKVKAYGNSAAFSAEMSEHDTEGDTINIDVAPSIERTPNWGAKLTLQLSHRELTLLAAVCLGYLPGCQLKRESKGVEIRRQPNRIFVRATAGAGVCHTLPLGMPETAKLGMLATHQLMRHPLANDSNQMINVIRGAAALHQSETKE